MHAGNLCLGVLAYVLRDLPADHPRCVALDSRSVLLLLYLFDEVLLTLLLRLNGPALHPLPGL